MKSRTTTLALSNVLLGSTLGVLLLARGSALPMGAALAQVALISGSSDAVAQQIHAAAPLSPSPSAVRVAQRLERRLQIQNQRVPSVVALARAVEQRRALLKTSVTISLTMPDGETHTEWVASPQRYPLWIVPAISHDAASFVLDVDRVRGQLLMDRIITLDPPQDAVLQALEKDAQGIVRAQTSTAAKDGYEVDVEGVVDVVRASIAAGQSSAAVPLLYRAGRIENATNVDLGDLSLLASGRSNFKGSDWGRIANVRKALREKVHNVIVPADAEFSFNDILGGPVTYSRGWSKAKVIFNGNELRDAPGGGICQASTTVYRAILNAGLPVTARASHSLYVSYYEAHGVGIDATIFPGKQDLRFHNDTGRPLLVQAYDDGYEAVVSIFGTPDGRSVELMGPYFSTNAPEDYLVNERPLRSNEIGWSHRVRYADGREVEEQVVSRYVGMPRSIVRKYTDLGYSSL